VPVPPPAPPAGGVRPWASRHFVNVVLDDLPAVADDFAVVLELVLVELLLPQAAIVRLAAITARIRNSRRVRLEVMVNGFKGGPFVLMRGIVAA
jgi:hypothetical protein